MLDLVSVASPFFPFALPAMCLWLWSTRMVNIFKKGRGISRQLGAEIQLRFIPLSMDKALYTALEPCSP
jgi:hypothetical protein